MKSYIQDGKTMDFTAGATIAAGNLVLNGSVVGVSVNDVANGSAGIVSVSGVHEVGKDSDEVAIGVPLYYNASSGKLTTTVGSNKLAGYAWEAAGSAAATVKVRLLF